MMVRSNINVLLPYQDGIHFNATFLVPVNSSSARVEFICDVNQLASYVCPLSKNVYMAEAKPGLTALPGGTNNVVTYVSAIFVSSWIGVASLWNMPSTMPCLTLPAIVVFVRRSARLNLPSIHPTRIVPAA